MGWLVVSVRKLPALAFYPRAALRDGGLPGMWNGASIVARWESFAHPRISALGFCLSNYHTLRNLANLATTGFTK
jgi:hypothetical protein